MNNKNIIIASLGILVIAIIIPIVMNYILCGSIGAQVTGESKDWLSFFGSYLGGVFTAYISFIILSKTISHNITVLNIQQKKQDLESLKKMLSEQVSMLDFAKIGTINLVITDSSQYQSEIQKLDSFREALTIKFNGYGLFYENSKDKPAQDYWSSYQKCVTQLFDDITEMTQLIAELPPHLDDSMVKFMESQIANFQAAGKNPSFAPDYKVLDTINEYQKRLADNARRQQLISSINTLVSKLGQHKDKYTNDTYTKAQSWIKSEESKVNSIKIS